MKPALYWIDRQFALLCGLCAGLIGLVNAAAWLSHAVWLRMLWAGYAPMQINTAVGLIIASAGLSVIERNPKIPSICGALLSVLGAATLLEYALRINLGFDTILYTHPLPAGPTRMAVNAAVCFLFSGAALVCAVFAGSRRASRLSNMGTLFFGYAVLIVAGSALTGYGLGLEVAYRWAGETEMSIFSAAGFLSLGAALFKIGWQRVTVNRTQWLTLLTGGLVAGTSILTWAAVDGAYRKTGQPLVVPDLMLFTGITRACIAAIVVFLWRSSSRRLTRERSRNTTLQGEVAERSAQLRAIFDAVKIGTWSHDLAAGQVSFEGHSRELFGLPASPAEVTFEDLIRATHPEDREKLREASRRAARHGENDIEFRVNWPDGSVHWILARGGVAQTADGRPIRLTGINLDITRLKSVENALQASEASVRKLNEALERRIRIQTKELVDSEKRFRLMVEGLEDYAFFMLDTEGHVVSWNKGAERITRYQADQIIGKHFMILCTEEDIARKHPEEELQTSVEQGRFEESGWRVRRDGTRFWAHILVTPVYDEAGDLCGFSELIRDITERKRSREEIESQRQRAEDANQAKSRFLASMSHEIRTPMNAILGMTDLLWETDLDEEQRHYVEIFRRAGASLMDLINDILDLSKIEAGRLKLERAEFSLEHVVSETVELLGSKARDKGVGLRARVDRGLPLRVIGDASRLRQILVNLIGNAIKFTSSGEVVVAVEPRFGGAPGEFTFLVADTGIGIPADKLKSIFEPFEQAEEGTARQFGGTGLGLWICQLLISCMGGTLEVESELGRGSTFHFSARFDLVMPDLTSVSPASKSENAVAAPAAANVGHPRTAEILVADDSLDNQFLIEAYLRGTSYTITRADDGREALEKFQERRFDLVLMDMQMPVMDGLSATRAIREFETTHHRNPVPILALTANAHSEAIQECRQAGCTLHLAKPVSKVTLLSALDEVLSLAPVPAPRPPEALLPDRVPAPRIEIPEGMEALAPRYLFARRRELPEMVALLAAADFDQIGSRGHNMKGTGRSYGFPDLTEIGAALERSAKNRDKDGVDKQLMRLANYLEGVQLDGEPEKALS